MQQQQIVLALVILRVREIISLQYIQNESTVTNRILFEWTFLINCPNWTFTFVLDNDIFSRNLTSSNNVSTMYIRLTYFLCSTYYIWLVNFLSITHGQWVASPYLLQRRSIYLFQVISEYDVLNFHAELAFLRKNSNRSQSHKRDLTSLDWIS